MTSFFRNGNGVVVALAGVMLVAAASGHVFADTINEVEPNDAASRANALVGTSNDLVALGTAEFFGSDYFRFTVTAPGTVQFSLALSPNLISDERVRLSVLTLDGTEVGTGAVFTSAGQPFVTQFDVNFAAGGDNFARVSHFGKFLTPPPYTLEIKGVSGVVSGAAAPGGAAVPEAGAATLIAAAAALHAGNNLAPASSESHLLIGLRSDS